MSFWGALRADAAIVRRLRYPRGGTWSKVGLWLRPGGMLVMFAQRLGHELRTRRAAGARWTPTLLTMRLVDVGDGCQRWGGRFEREVDDEFAAQEALAQEVVEAMRRELGGAPST